MTCIVATMLFYYAFDRDEYVYRLGFYRVSALLPYVREREGGGGGANILCCLVLQVIIVDFTLVLLTVCHFLSWIFAWLKSRMIFLCDKHGLLMYY